MNKRITVAALVLALGIGGAQAMRAEAAATEPKPQGDLTIVVVESLEQGPGRLANFDRMSEVFTDVFTARKWPLNIKIERFASNTQSDATQLRVFYKGTYEETPGELSFHAWMTLYEHGNKHDFGVVTYRYQVRPFQQEEIILERVFRGAAEVAADKVKAVLFPKAPGKKP